MSPDAQSAYRATAAAVERLARATEPLIDGSDRGLAVPDAHADIAHGLYRMALALGIDPMAPTPGDGAGDAAASGERA